MLNHIVTVNHLDDNLEPTQSTGKLKSINDNNIVLVCLMQIKVIEVSMASKIELAQE